MHLREFIRLSLKDRLLYTTDHGTFVAADPSRPCTFHLLHDFYVEVRLADDASRVIGVMPFKTGTRYERMLESITMTSSTLLT
jgi:hypothetical protein